MDASVAARLVGSYDMKWEPLPPEMMVSDSTLDTDDELPSDARVTIRYEGGELRATMDPPMFASEPGYGFALRGPDDSVAARATRGG